MDIIFTCKIIISQTRKWHLRIWIDSTQDSLIAYVIDDRIRTHPKIPLDHADCQVEAFFIILFYFIFNTRL